MKLSFCLALIFSPVLALAQISKEPAKKDSANSAKPNSQRYSIIYGSPNWNQNPQKIDNAFLIIKDKATQKLIQIELEETEPDSSEFKGNFHVSLGDSQMINPEVYIPAQASRGQLDKFFQLIQSGKLARKPTITKRNKNENIIDVYDSRDQAEKAWALYQEQKARGQQAQQRKLPVSVVGTGVLDKTAEMLRAAKVQADQENERMRLEQIERKKIEERLAEQAKLDETTKARRRAEAREWAAKGMKAYDAKDFLAATEAFKKSAELDPDNKEFYFKYGVSLYKNQKYNEALVQFEVAPPNPETDLEKNYFMGLALYQLKEWDRALLPFREAAKSGHSDLGPSALFYEGVILYNKEDYEAAKKPFEQVLDTSKDPALDQQAEDYLEAIADALVLQKMRSKKWFLGGTVGLMYDSNVLLAPDLETAQGVSAKEGDVRVLTVGDITYKAWMNQTASWDLTASANLTHSSKNDLAYADPWLYSLSSPYAFQLKGRTYKRMAFTPGIETLYMAEPGNSSKTNILNSAYLNVDYMEMMRPDWFALYTLGYRRDDASSPSSDGVNDLDANKYSLYTTQTFLLGKKRKESVAGTAGLILNQAVGSERKYQRLDLSVSYGKPIWKTYNWGSSLAYYLLQFPDSTADRKDSNFTLSTSLSTPVRDWCTLGLSGSYTTNGSNVSTYDYDRYTVLTTATFNTAF